jgi:hypothetical protein
VVTSLSAATAQPTYLKASNTRSNDVFGWRVAVSGDTMVVGAYGESSKATGVNGDQGDTNAPNAGAAYVFVRSGTNWVQQAYLKASNAEAQDSFGVSVAVSGNTVVVGALSEASNATGVNGEQSNNGVQYSGAAYVFVRNGTNWNQQAYLKPSNTGVWDNFGWSVAIAGDTVVVGANYEDSNATGVNGQQYDDSAVQSGAAYVFVRSGTNWSQQAYLKASNTGAYDEFGCAVAVSGDTLVVGAYQEDCNATGVNGSGIDPQVNFNSGAAYVFVRSGTNWTQQAYLKASNTGGATGFGSPGDWFGRSVAVSGDTAVVGANGEASNATGVNGNQSDNSTISSGAAYVFVRTGTNWTQQAYLKAFNTRPGDYFGSSVAVSGDTVVVSSPSEDSDASGVNGDASNTLGTNSGAAYVFVRNGTNWAQRSYLKASNTGVADNFGWSVAISGDTVAVGAPWEDSDATGVNGAGSDPDWNFNSGAAYVFTGFGVGPRLTIARDGESGCYVRFSGAPDVSYRVQRATSLSGPWDTVATLTAPAIGLLEYHDTNAPPAQAFYRTAQP